MATAIHQGLRLYYQHLAISTTLALFLSMGCIEVPQKDETGAIRIGALLPFTGEQAASGFNLERPLLMAVDVINEAGGIAGKEVVLIAEDSNAMFK